MVRKKQTEKTKAETKNRNKHKLNFQSRKGGEHHEETGYVPGRVF